MEEQQKIIGDVIRNARIEKGLTQSDLGNILGVTKNAVYRYEKGLINDIPFEKRILLADTLEIPYNTLGLDTQFRLDFQIYKITNSNELLESAYDANRFNNKYLDLLNKNGIIPLIIEREQYLIIPKSLFNSDTIQKIKENINSLFQNQAKK